jgi:hypothetical protein
MAAVLCKFAFVFSLAAPSLAFSFSPSFHGSAIAKFGSARSSPALRKAAGVVMAEKTNTPEEFSRRSFLLGLSSLAVTSSPLSFPVVANALNGTVFEDTQRAFTVAVPPGWIQGTAEFPGGSKSPSAPRIVSFLSSEDKDVNLAIVSYYVQPDQSKLGALGSIEDVARTILGTAFNLDSGAEPILHSSSCGFLGAQC